MTSSRSNAARGAIATKLVVALAMGAGVLWTVPFTPRVPLPVVLDTANTPPPARPGPATDALSAPASTVSAAADPFAGVDVRGDPVLRHIAGIEEPKRSGRGDAASRKEAPVRVAAAPSVTTSDAARTQPSAPAAQTAPIASLPEAAPPATANGVADPQAARVGETPAKQARDEPVLPPPAPPAVQMAPVLARADPAPAPQAAPAVVPPRATRRTAPLFPTEAIKAGIKTGRVLARITIDADGRVSDSQILSARPPGYFEKESQRTLSAWRYEASGKPASTEVELLFSRD